LVDAYVEYLRAFQPRLQAMVSLIEKAASMAMGPGWVGSGFSPWWVFHRVLLGGLEHGFLMGYNGI
jgi:hypothetical protein